MNYNLDISEIKLNALINAHKQVAKKKDAYKLNAIILLAKGYSYC